MRQHILYYLSLDWLHSFSFADTCASSVRASIPQAKLFSHQLYLCVCVEITNRARLTSSKLHMGLSRHHQPPGTTCARSPKTKLLESDELPVDSISHTWLVDLLLCSHSNSFPTRCHMPRSLGGLKKKSDGNRRSRMCAVVFLAADYYRIRLLCLLFMFPVSNFSGH